METFIRPNISAYISSHFSAHALPPALIHAMLMVESTGNPFAMRFEPAFYDRYLKGKPLSFTPPSCSIDTEAIGRATSWGLLQIMGETARCLGFRGWFGELLTPEIGLEWGCRYLARLRDRFLNTGGWEVVSRAYNGGPGNAHNPANTYPAKVLAHLPGGVWPQEGF
ncbi:Lytic transglycosylase catalytic [Solidesulfovibrio carbinoliphilus subsp. oakridgensis]|uniref:Lytic transglycosylase catalytic n=1 Tax=Solidesulfovibrio carbinoliphilus subsp. oakridgensis TaxID=694327 RepID=G7QD45_9BACT|nr:transglycosylase SLT domain-containing protein [Solidesulfovibrio carbinoliphilus]EHJ46351.1 Lytic transglycosylase catalytic [Solidesulfovibrio carbinoliphilus subsp. oakridgensis]